jgi:hypothetical protein
VIRDINTGRLELAESASGVGVRSKPLIEVIPRYNKISRKKYLGDFRDDSVFKTIETDEPVYEEVTQVFNKNKIDRTKLFGGFSVREDIFDFFFRKSANNSNYKTGVIKEVVVTNK